MCGNIWEFGWYFMEMLIFFMCISFLSNVNDFGCFLFKEDKKKIFNDERIFELIMIIKY